MNWLPQWLDFWSEIFPRLPSRMRGKHRLARWILGNRIPSGEIQVRVEEEYEMILPNLQEPIAFSLFVDGEYEPELKNCMLDYLHRGSVFVDVGANVGSFTIPAADCVGAMGKVLAIEPSPHIFPYLKSNVLHNGLSNVCLEKAAVSDREDGKVKFYEAPDEKFGMGSLAPQFNADPIRVKSKRLDDILEERGIEKVDFMKVDVEGFEAAVFRGAERLLSGSEPPRLAFEFCDWAEARRPNGQIGDAQRVLRSYGYRIWRLADFLNGEKPLTNILTNGFTTLIATKDKI